MIQGFSIMYALLQRILDLFVSNLDRCDERTPSDLSNCRTRDGLDRHCLQPYASGGGTLWRNMNEAEPHIA